MRDLEEAFELTVAAEPAEKKMREAKIRDPKEALAKGVITKAEADLLKRALAAHDRVVRRGCVSDGRGVTDRQPATASPSAKRKASAKASCAVAAPPRPGRPQNNGRRPLSTTAGSKATTQRRGRQAPRAVAAQTPKAAARKTTSPAVSGTPTSGRAGLHRRRRAHAVPAGARQAGTVHARRSGRCSADARC